MPNPTMNFAGMNLSANGSGWRPSNRYWFIQYSGGGVGIIQWGASGDTPVPGNYNGDSTTDISVWRPTLGNWYVYGQFVIQ